MALKRNVGRGSLDLGQGAVRDANLLSGKDVVLSKDDLDACLFVIDSGGVGTTGVVQPSDPEA